MMLTPREEDIVVGFEVALEWIARESGKSGGGNAGEVPSDSQCRNSAWF